jgi:hypothetical protein
MGMSDCHTARNGVDQVRNLQRALYRKCKQEQEARFYSVYDKGWRTDVLWEAWRQVKATRGAPGIDGKTIEEIVESGQEEGMIQKLQAALQAHHYQFAPVRVVEIPKPKGGTRPLGIATVEDRVVQTAMKLILEPIFEADFHACSYGYRPKRDAKPRQTRFKPCIKRGLGDPEWQREPWVGRSADDGDDVCPGGEAADDCRSPPPREESATSPGRPNRAGVLWGTSGV